jgi:hypothetical protein
MKKIIVLTILIITIPVFLLLSGCNRVGSVMNGSGNIKDQPIEVTDFTDLNVAGPFVIEVTQSNSYNIILSVDDNLLNRVLVTRENGTLNLGIQAPASFFPSVLKVKISMPVIKNIILTDNVKASLSGFSNLAGFILISKQGSSLNGYLDVDNIDLNLSEGSQVNLKGVATRLQLECSGKSKLDFSDFVLSSANVRVIGASEAILNVNGRFDVIMEGASKIQYLGNPVFYNTSISGDSTMSREQSIGLGEEKED